MSADAVFSPRADLTPVAAVSDRIRQYVTRLIMGQDEPVDLMIAALLADGHILIEGVPGVAKTLTARLLARSLDALFSRIQFTPDLMPSDVLGTSIFNARTATFEFRPGPVFGQIVFIDEINRAPAKTQAALFEVMEERQVTLDGQTYQMEPPFIVLASQNPIEQEGTYRLPEAQLDRFLFKIEMGYPDEQAEYAMLAAHLASLTPGLARDPGPPVVTSAELIEAQSLVRKVHIEPDLVRYIVQITAKTRSSKDVYLGASPRASVYLMRAAQAWAAMQGRDFVTPEDIRSVAGPVLRHRILLTPEREMEGVTPDEIIRHLAGQVSVPR
ncbi:MAG: MoxR family ATPase [Bacteroidia bacterium]|nr:MoxR family ATPase [Bacteroidia bacterium]